MRKPSSGKILVADDEPRNVEIVSRLMRRFGHQVVSAFDGVSALEAVAKHKPDIVLLDVSMPRLDGFEVCRRLKKDPETHLIPVILLTGMSATAARVDGIEAGADDFLTKPFVTAELTARVTSLLRLKRCTDDLESASSVIMSLALTVEARDPYTAGHCERLGEYSAALGIRLGLDEDQCTALYRGGYLHDIGKIGIPDAVLLKDGSLTTGEYSVMQRHTIIGDSLCGNMRSLRDVLPIIRHHHERLDGSGYPDRLSGEEVPLLAQIVSIVDAYDAMTTTRAYRRALSPEHARQELRNDVRKGWKQEGLVEPFIEMMSEPGGASEPAPARSALSLISGLTFDRRRVGVGSQPGLPFFPVDATPKATTPSLPATQSTSQTAAVRSRSASRNTASRR